MLETSPSQLDLKPITFGKNAADFCQNVAQGDPIPIIFDLFIASE